MSRLAIGTVEHLEGKATVIHADGSVDTLQSGDRVFADDAISTQQNTVVNIKFLDGSILNIGPQYTAVLGKEVYDSTGNGLVAEIADTVPGATSISHIGAVVAADGDTTVIRADGRAYELGHGDLLYANDIIKVGTDGHASIKMLDGSFMSFGPESLARLDDDLFPSRYPDFVSSGITDAATIRAAILAGQDPADVTRPPAAGATDEEEDVGNSFVVLERSGRAVTPESGHETTGPTESFGEIIDELLQPPVSGDSVISISSIDGVGAAVIEGGTLVFSIELDKPNPAADVSATWTLNPGSADISDFPPGSVFTGIVTIPAGATTATIEIPTLDDTLFEGGLGTFEDVTLELTDISNALPGDLTAGGIIEDNDAPPTVTITGDGDLADAEAIEGNPLVFTLTLSNPSAETITLDLAATDGSAGSADYNNTGFEVLVNGNWVAAGGTNGTEVSFAPGQDTLQVRLMTLDDDIDEPSETMTLGINSVVTGDVGDITDTATGTILDNDAPPIVTITGDCGLADAEAIEGNPLVFTLTLSNPSAETITLDLAATDGSAGSADYNNTGFEVLVNGNWVAAGGTNGTEVSFAPGQDTLQVRLMTLDDDIDEPSETMTLGINSVVTGDVGDITDTATGTILDNDAPPIVTITGDGGLADAEAIEGNPLVFTLTLSNPSAETITLDLAATDGSAGSADYNNTGFEVLVNGNWVAAGGTNGTEVSFAPGQDTLQVRLMTLDDDIDEPSETMTLGINSVVTGDVGDITDTATGTILDNDAPPIVTITGDGGLADAEAIEGNPLVFTLTLSNPSAETITLDLAATDGSAGSADYNNTGFEVLVNGNWVAAGGTNGTEVSFAPGQDTLQVRLMTLDDDIDEPSETMTLGINSVVTGDVGDITDTATGTILDNDAPPIVTITGDGGLADAEAIEGNPLVFTLTLSNPSAETITLDLAATDGSAGSADYNNTGFEVLVNGNWVAAGGTNGTEVSFAPGQDTLQVRLMTLDDDIDEPSETMTLGINSVVTGDVGDITDTATGTILDNDAPPIVTITGDGGLADAEAIEGNPLVFTLTLSNPSAETITLDLAATDGSAGSADYNNTGFEVLVNGNWVAAGGTNGTEVSFAPGQDTLQVRLMTLDDDIDEPSETMTLGINSVVTGDVGDITDTATGTILDNDAPPIVTITGDGGLADAEAIEGNPLVFTLTLSNPSAETITLDLAATDGSAGSADYNNTGFEVLVNGNWVAAGGTNGTEVSFAPGQDTLQVRLMTLDDDIDEPSETMTLGINSVVTGDVGDITDTATGTILDNDILVTDDLFGQVTEAALFDGPGGNDDGSQEDPTQPAVNTVDSGTLTFAGGELTGVTFDSGPAGDGVVDLSNSDPNHFILEARDGATVLWRLTVDKVDGVTSGGQIGDYKFELFNNIDHPLENLAFGDDALQAQFSYTVTSPGGSESGSLTIDINDDRPDAIQVVADVGDAPIVTNLVVVLDRSGSMNQTPDGSTLTRLELAKAAIADLLAAWSELGEVNVMVVDFAGSATHATDGPGDPWLTTDQANAYVSGITANSVTNYEAAASEVIGLFPGGGLDDAAVPPVADQSYVYWLTDGRPNRGDIDDLVDPSWTGFLDDEGFAAAYAVGVGGDLNALDPELQDVAWPNDTEFSALNPDGNLIIVDDARDLSDTLVSTVVNRVEGNIINDALPNSTFGADGPGLLVSLTVDGVLYTYNPADGGTITPDNGGSVITGSVLSADTPLGGNLIFNFDSGDYSYAIPQVNGVESETFTYSVVDADGDETATPNEFIVRVHEVDDVVNGSASADILTGGDGSELIIGGDGDDTIDGGGGSDVIRGGLGADTFIVRELTEGVDTILDYNFIESDVLDISDILVGYDPNVDVIAEFVKVAADGTVAVNPNPSDPGSSFTDIAVLSNIAPGATVIVQVTEDMTANLEVMA